MVPTALWIARLDSNFILPPSFAAHEERGALWRSKQFGAYAVLFGPSFGRAYQY
jgi:hypothetical protein